MNIHHSTHQTKLKQVHQEFLDYCYNMQYEYEFFRSLDRITEIDYDGNEYYVYTTFDDW